MEPFITRIFMVLTLITVTFSTMGTAFAGLGNDDIPITMVDVLQDAIYIHLDTNGDLNQAPACSIHKKIIACPLNQEYCKFAMSVALSAFVSGKKIDFSLGNECIGGAPKFTRLRVK